MTTKMIASFPLFEEEDDALRYLFHLEDADDDNPDLEILEVEMKL